MLQKILFKHFFICLFFIIIHSNVFPQVDSAYINPYPINLTTKIYLTSKFNTILYRSPMQTMTLEPNSPLGIGLGVSWKKFGMSFSYGFGFMRNQKKGNTKSFDIQINNYGRKIVLDIMVQIYKGFYEDNHSANKYKIYKDLSTVRIGAFGQYIFNSRKFSYNAAFNLKEQQLLSAGSWLLGGGIYFNRIDFGTDTLGKYEKQNNFQLGPSGGYAYTWVIKKNFFITLSLSVGVNIGVNMEDHDFMIAPTATPRFAMGYNGKSWGVNMSYVNHLIYTVISERKKIGSSTGNLQLAFIKRFIIPQRKK